jgi:LmbE family N-acetylglucosaminyl deacetylase
LGAFKDVGIIMKKFILFLLCLSLVAGQGISGASSNTPFTAKLSPQSDRQIGIVGLSQTLKELANPYNLMSVATTLDDVDFSTLAYYRQKLGAHTAIVLATRGEQEFANPSAENPAIEQTKDILQAAHAVDADVYFLNLRNTISADSVEEALSNWGKEAAAKQMVQAIRWLRPDAIISDHDGKTGNAEQQALGRLLIEAFDSAADSKISTGSDAEAWQAKRLFLKTDANNAEVIINGNEFDSLRGKTYRQAVLPASTKERQLPVTTNSFYRLALSVSGEQRQLRKSFFDGFTLPEKLRLSITPPVVGNLSLMEALTLPERLAEALTEKLIEKRAEGSIAILRERYGKEFFRVVRFTENLERAIAIASGIRCEMALSDTIIAQGETFTAQISFHNNSNTFLSMVFHMPDSLPVAGKKVSYKTSAVINVAPSDTVSREIIYQVAQDTPVTLPREKHIYDDKYYPASSLRFSQQPSGNLLFAYAEVNLGQTTISLPVLQRFDVAEPFEISVSPDFAFVKDWSAPRDVELTVRIRKRLRSSFAGALWVVPMALQLESYEPLPLRLTVEDEEAIVKLNLKLPIMRPPLSPDILLELRRDKPAAPVPLTSIKVPVKMLDCEVTQGVKIGFIAKSDSQLLQALAVLGIESTKLSVEEVSVNQHGVKGGEQVNQVCANLSRFDTIIVDALAYSQDVNLLAKNRCLLEYARRGGNLVVFYQRPDFWNSVFTPNSFAPFPIKLSNEKIISKNKTFKPSNAEHILMLKPNKIEEKDFQDWSNYLAFYLPKEWSGDYETLIEMENGNGEAQKGSLLLARYGEGSFIYASLNFHRQWRDARAGAYKLLANLISLPKVLK